VRRSRKNFVSYLPSEECKPPHHAHAQNVAPRGSCFNHMCTSDRMCPQNFSSAMRDHVIMKLSSMGGFLFARLVFLDIDRIFLDIDRIFFGHRPND